MSSEVEEGEFLAEKVEQRRLHSNTHLKNQPSLSPKKLRLELLTPLLISRKKCQSNLLKL